MSTNKDQLLTNLKYLKMPCMSENIDDLVARAARKQMPHMDFITSIIAAEADAKRDRAGARRLCQAHFPYIKTMDAYEWTYPTKINRDLIRHLASLEFLANNGNVAFLGGPGMGKTHLAIALAHQACLAGHSVRFDTAINIINCLDAAQQAGTFVRAMRTYTAPNLLVLDEIGYLPIDQRGADLLFQVISGRYERGSIIVTSNRAFKNWDLIFNNDRTIASAVLDRLLHHCEVIVIEGQSYRMKGRSDN